MGEDLGVKGGDDGDISAPHTEKSAIVSLAGHAMTRCGTSRAEGVDAKDLLEWVIL